MKRNIVEVCEDSFQSILSSLIVKIWETFATASMDIFQVTQMIGKSFIALRMILRY